MPRTKSQACIPSFAEPMMARTATAIPAGSWLYEIKLDGFRALALLGATATRLMSRNEKDFAARFPEIVAALEKFPLRDSVLDGEVVALAADGRSSFQLLGNRDEEPGRRAPLVYYVFDVLRLAGRDVTHLPLGARKQLLGTVFTRGLDPQIRFSDSISSDGTALLAEAHRLGLEGIIGKKADSTYEIGARSGAWIKLKLLREQEFVIGGYTEPEGSRTQLGALVLGVHVAGRLHYVGKAGSGYTDNTLRELGTALMPRIRSTCPFVNLPERVTRGRSGGMTRAAMTRCHWVEPELVCQVRFTEWTRDAHLRHPVFLGLRPDKAPADVVREREKS